jgi:hypothetical protein
MDDAGHVVFDVTALSFNCVNRCYQIFENGSLLTDSTATLPSYAWEYSAGFNTSGVSDNGWTATLSTNPNDEFLKDLYVSSATNTPQLLLTAHDLGGLLAINGVGDIIFDRGTQDEWYEALNLTTLPTPEPSSLLLMGTGIAAGIGLVRRKLLI